LAHYPGEPRQFFGDPPNTSEDGKTCAIIEGFAEQKRGHQRWLNVLVMRLMKRSWNPRKNFQKLDVTKKYVP
jgi:hypothetical protein